MTPSIHSDGATVVVAGDLDDRCCHDLRAAIYDVLRLTGHHDCVVDLSSVDSVDLGGARMLALASRRARAAGRHLVLRGCGLQVRRQFALAGLSRLVEIEAVAS